MTYVQNGRVDAVDFNNFAGTNPTTAPNTVNATWATGGGSIGYGQPSINAVNTGSLVTASNEWNSLISNIANSASHQGTSITSINAPVSGNTISFSSTLNTNLQLIFNNRLNAAIQGATVSNTVTRSSSWTSQLVFTHTVSFVNGDAARYFFNAGGQIKLSVSHPTGADTNLLFSDLASNVGNVVVSAPSAGTALIAGTVYNGVTRINGGGTTPTIDSTRGYYGLTSSNSTIFTQTASTGPIEYQDSFISVIARTNGTQGINNDAGSVITIRTIWEQVPDGLTVSNGTQTIVDVVAPETTFIANTWGVISVSGTVTGT
jgi:hypothetical protein